MSGRATAGWPGAALAAALILGGPTTLAAQETPAPPAPSAPAPSPTPLPVLNGAGLDTLRALAAALAEEMAHVMEGAQAAAGEGRPAGASMPGIRMFRRRVEWLRSSVDKYRTEPFDVAGAAGAMHLRAMMLSRRARRSGALRQTWEHWDAAVDLLDRIKKLLAGQSVALPSPHARPRPAPAASPAPTPAPR